MTVPRLGDQTGIGLGARHPERARTQDQDPGVGGTGSGTAQRYRPENDAGLPGEERADGFA